MHVLFSERYQQHSHPIYGCSAILLTLINKSMNIEDVGK
jgi:hypothetical protein